jgi:hypothetical protein
MFGKHSKKNNSHYNFPVKLKTDLRSDQNDLRSEIKNKSNISFDIHKNFIDLNISKFDSDSIHKQNTVINLDDYRSCDTNKISNLMKEDLVESEDVVLILNKKFTCRVCYLQEINKANIYEFECFHQFCRSCLEQYFEISIKENKLNKIKCLEENCDCKIPHTELVKILSEKSFEKFSKFFRRNEILKDPSKIICPFPDCEEYADKNVNYLDKEKENLQTNGISSLRIFDTEASSWTRSRFMSSINFQNIELKTEDAQNAETNTIKFSYRNISLMCNAGHKFCSECKKLDWHPNQNCSKEHIEFLNFLQNTIQDFKNCPFCGIWIEKLVGCNHMVCLSCNKQWCWLCREEFKQDHYSNKESKCFGKMYEGSNIAGNLMLNNIEPNMNIIQNGQNVDFQNNILNFQHEATQLDSSYYFVGYKFFGFEIIYYKNCFLRLFTSLIMMIVLVFTNYGMLRGVSTYLDKSFSFIEERNMRQKKIKFDLINIFISMSVWIYTFPLSILISLIVYGPSLISYTCKCKK